MYTMFSSVGTVYTVLPLYQTEKSFFYPYFDQKILPKSQKFLQISFIIYVKLSRILYVKSAKDNFFEVVRGTGLLLLKLNLFSNRRVSRGIIRSADFIPKKLRTD